MDSYNFWTVLSMIVILTGGSAFVMWLGERVTDRGVGNGISIILLINIVSTMPNDFKNIYTQFIKGKDAVRMCLIALLVVAIVVCVPFLYVCFRELKERFLYSMQRKFRVESRWEVSPPTFHLR